MKKILMLLLMVSLFVSSTKVFANSEDHQLEQLEICLSRPSTEADSDLALIAAKLCDKSDDINELNEYLANELRFSMDNIAEYTVNERTYSWTGDYGDSFTYVIAEKAYKGPGVDDETGIIVVVVQDTEISYDPFGKYWELAQQGVVDPPTQGHIFEYGIYPMLSTYWTDFSQKVSTVMSHYSNYKLLITGHNFGGAAANLSAANLTGINLGTDNIYCYTFGAADYVDHNTLDAGFENIHNITNFYGATGIDGWRIDAYYKYLSNFGKFGHIDYLDSTVSGFDSKGKNSEMSCYLYAVEHGLIDYEKSASESVTIIRGPVDVHVFHGDELVASVTDHTTDSEANQIPVNITGTDQYYLISNDDDYRFEISATDDGQGSFSVINAYNKITVVNYDPISLKDGERLVSFVDGDVEKGNVKLYTTEANGSPLSEVQPDGTEIPYEEVPSISLQSDVYGAIDAELVPENLRSNYHQYLSRGNAAQLFINALEWSTGKTTDEFLTEKGVSVNPDAFTDTDDPAILAANALGIIKGIGNQFFDPDGVLTRAQAAAMIDREARMLGIETEGYTHSFTDVIGHWAEPELGWLENVGIIKGVGDNQFEPDGLLTTEQAVAFAYRSCQVLASLWKEVHIPSKVYTLHVDLNGGYGPVPEDIIYEPSSQTGTCSIVFDWPSQKPVRYGYRFMWWIWVDKSGKGIACVGPILLNDENTDENGVFTVYAKWERLPRIPSSSMEDPFDNYG